MASFRIEDGGRCADLSGAGLANERVDCFEGDRRNCETNPRLLGEANCFLRDELGFWIRIFNCSSNASAAAPDETSLTGNCISAFLPERISKDRAHVRIHPEDAYGGSPNGCPPANLNFGLTGLTETQCKVSGPEVASWVKQRCDLTSFWIDSRQIRALLQVP
jgi:hypothetical protein